MRDTMRPRRIEESARRAQHEHGGDGVIALGAGEQVVHELRRNRMDDPVVLADDDQGPGWFRLRLERMASGGGTQDTDDRSGNGSGSQRPVSDDRDEPHTGCAFHGTCDLNPSAHLSGRSDCWLISWKLAHTTGSLGRWHRQPK